MTARYRASATLEAFILSAAPEHVARPDAPSTFEALKAAQAAGGPLPVYDGGCAQTIYSRPEVNHAFRAWHDQLHLASKAPFDAEGERAVAWEHAHAARRAGLSGRDELALLFDTWGQFLYAERHDGEFPNDQAAFVAACFARGIEAAISETF